MEFLLGLLLVMFLVSKVTEKMQRGGILGVVFSFVWKILVSIFSFMFFGYKRSTYGSAVWLHEWKADFISHNNDGLAVNGTKFVSKEDSTQHCLVVGGSGTGKSVTLAIPSVWNAAKHGSGSLILTDPSSELFLRTGNFLNRSGYTVHKIDLGDPDNSACFNPILMANSPSAVDSLAKILVTTAMGGMGKDPFWNLSAVSLLTTLIALIKTLPPDEQTFGKLKEWITKVSVPALRDEIDQLAASSLPVTGFNEYLAFFSQPDKLLHSIISVCKAVMTNIDENVEKVTRSHTIDLSGLRSGKVAIFVCVPEHQQQRYSFVLSLFYEMVFDFCYQMPSTPNSPYNHIFLLLDEFANMEIQDMPTHITTLRKRAVSITLIIQSFSQLRLKYQQNADTLIGNCKLKIFFGGLDIDTCENISRTIGMTNYTIKQNPFNPFEKGRELSRRLIQAEELRMLDPKEVLAIFGSENPIKLKATPYFKNRSILRDLER